MTAAAPPGRAQPARRLAPGTPWRPDRTLGFAPPAEPVAVALAGDGVLDGVRGASADGGTWRIEHGRTDFRPPHPAGGAA
ncbi:MULTISPECIES: hypothetical protein [Kitasatospora]|uniref:Uncharacterized protein n=1 Tax=Kitasatospora setae (strain ATCC 33774 / DSM 43861 / JCM 3304 / KCC A-0304 / NBRC 14216 / KM-6054) TaxID=452652 RepID=E4N3Z6_KITSK|nr:MULTISPECIES: hypothetical protein [Kitasatospora]BAJ31627.1 hypothetical protein KSE_58570 [Kitasatospora setae KM-6054]